MEKYQLNKIINEIIPFTTLKSSSLTLTTQNQAYKCPSSELSDRQVLVIYNASDSDIYIGGSDVSTSNGLTLASEKYIVIGAESGVYAVCGSASKSIRLLEAK